MKVGMKAMTSRLTVAAEEEVACWYSSARGKVLLLARRGLMSGMA